MAPTTQDVKALERPHYHARCHRAGSGPGLPARGRRAGVGSFLDGLAERFTVYAPEHPGTTLGDPDGIRALDDLWDLVLYYDELFDALGLERRR